MAQYSAGIALIAALFVGFLQLPGWALVPIAALSVWGMRYEHPGRQWRAYVKSFVTAGLMLPLFAWLAQLASLWMSGHQFVQPG